MDTVKERYHIVKFTTALPYKKCKQFGCVPKCWMTYIDKIHMIALVYYPSHPTRNMDVKNMNKPESIWARFVVKIFHSTNNYAEARRKLKLFNSTTNGAIQKKTDCASTSKRIPKSQIDEDFKPGSIKPKNGTKKPLKRVLKTNTDKKSRNKAAKIRKLTEEDSVKNPIESTDDSSLSDSEDSDDDDDETSINSKIDISEDIKAIESILDESKSTLRYLKEDDEVQAKLTKQILDILNSRDNETNNEVVNENSESENEEETANVNVDQLSRLQIENTFTIKEEDQLQFY